MELLKELCAIHAPSGSEKPMRDFILHYISKNQEGWKAKPNIISEGIQDCIILLFGKPRTAVFAHIDSIGFTVGYNNTLRKIGSPDCSHDWNLVGSDSKGTIDGKLQLKDDQLYIEFERMIDRGTTLTFKPDFKETKKSIQSPYMDNRLGCYSALRLCEKIENGAIVFSCWEEHGGGSVGYLAEILYKKYGISQALISDITWVTDGVTAGDGVAISLRDSGIPRRTYLNRILEIAKSSKIPFQIEVEGSGGSDGNELQKSPFPFDWCFVGAPEKNVHSPKEKVNKQDIESMISMYVALLKEL